MGINVTFCIRCVMDEQQNVNRFRYRHNNDSVYLSQKRNVSAHAYHFFFHSRFFSTDK